MKSYTNIEQSNELAEILPIESADMSYSLGFDSEKYEVTTAPYKNWVIPKYAQTYKGFSRVIPCWSLTALLNVLPSATLDSSDDHYFRIRCRKLCTEWHDNAVDTCVEMIEELHGLEML